MTGRNSPRNGRPSAASTPGARVTVETVAFTVQIPSNGGFRFSHFASPPCTFRERFDPGSVYFLMKGNEIVVSEGVRLIRLSFSIVNKFNS